MCLDTLPEHVSSHASIQCVNVRLAGRSRETTEPWFIFLHLELSSCSSSCSLPLPLSSCAPSAWCFVSNPEEGTAFCSPLWMRDLVCVCLPAIAFALSSLPDMMDGTSAINQRPASDAWHLTAEHWVMGALAAACLEIPGVLRGCACGRLCGSASWFRPAPPATWLPEGCPGHFWAAAVG